MNNAIDSGPRRALWCHANPDRAAEEIERLTEALEQILKMADGAYASSWMSMPDAWQRIHDMRLRARAALESSP